MKNITIKCIHVYRPDTSDILYYTINDHTNYLYSVCMSELKCENSSSLKPLLL